MIMISRSSNKTKPLQYRNYPHVNSSSSHHRGRRIKHGIPLFRMVPSHEVIADPLIPRCALLIGTKYATPLGHCRRLVLQKTLIEPSVMQAHLRARDELEIRYLSLLKIRRVDNEEWFRTFQG